MEAERVVVELIAKVDGFDGKVKQSATAFEGGMKRIEQGAVRAETAVDRSMASTERSFGRAAQASRNLGYQISDIGTQLAAGTSPFLVLAQQGPQVANALDGAKGAVGRFAGFLSGPWGAAMLAATTILGGLIAKNLEFGDSIDDLVAGLKKQAEKARDAKDAQEIFGNSIEGVTKALEDNREALDKLKGVQDTAAEATLKAAEAEAVKAVRLRESTLALLEQARAREELNKSIGVTDPLSPDSAVFNQAQTASRIRELEALVQSAKANVLEAGRQIVDAQSAISVERGSADAAEQINRRYDALVEGARQAAVASGKVGKALEDEVKKINAARDAELRRQRDTEAARRRTDSSLPKVTGGEVARLIGAPITSGTRTAAQNKAAKGADNSYHLSGQAIDIPITVNGKPLTKAGIRAALEPAGVAIKELLGPGDKGHDDHFHIAFDKTRRGPDQVANAQTKANEAAERAAVAEEQRRQSFLNELASLQDSEIDARQRLITSAEEIAQLEVDAIELSRKKYDDNLNSLVEQKKLTADEAKQLRGINEERAKLRAELVKRREDERKFRMAEAERQRAAQFASAQAASAAELLQGQLDLARTQKERRAIERRLLDLQYAEERARNEYVIAYAERLRLQASTTESEQNAADAAADEARMRNGTIDQRKENDTKKSDRGTAGPLEAYMDSIPKTADEINEALESVAAGGLATFTDALTDAIVNFKSLGDVGRAVLQSITAGLVKMAIQQIIVHTIGKTLSKGAIAGVGAEAATVGAAWAPAAALASLATLGANAAPAAAALAATTALSMGLAATGAVGRKDGGPIFGRGGPRDDKVLMAASPGEYVIKARSAAKLGRSALDRLNLTGELPAAFAGGGPVGSVRPSNGPAAKQGRGGISEDALRRIEGAVERGAATQMPVNLYPTLSPKSAMQAMLSDPGSQRLLFDFIGNNSTAFNSRLSR